MDKTLDKGSLTLPAAIIVAGAIVAIALIWINKPAGSGSDSANVNKLTYPNPAGTEGMAPVTEEDHILGNPNAPIKLVEYSDPSCPYCKLFNPTMEQIMTKYGPGGKVAWVYRQLPLYVPDSQGRVIHPNSGNQAEALECAAALGGNTGFFSFLKKWFIDFPTEAATRGATEDAKAIAATAKAVGLDTVSFNECLTSHRFKTKVATSYQEGLAAGVDGTPYLIIITPSGNKITLSGGQSYTTLQNTIDTLITTIPEEDTSATPAQDSPSILIN